LFITGTLIGVNTSAPHSSALIDMSSSDKALRVTRLTDPSNDVVSPRNGMIAYDSTNNTLEGYISGSWVDLGASGGGTPGGSDTQVQYNNSGSFGGISQLTYDGTDLTLTSTLSMEGVQVDGTFKMNNAIFADTTRRCADGETLVVNGTKMDCETPAAGSSPWTDGGSFLYPTSSEAIAAGTNTQVGAAAMTVSGTMDVTGTVKIGSGSSGVIDFGTNTLTDSILGNILIDYIDFPVQSAKISGDFIVDGTMQIDAGEGHWALLADTTTHEYAGWQFRVPNTYGSNPVAKIQYSMASATSGKVDIEVDVMCVTDGDSAEINTASFDTVNEITGGTTVPGTAGYLDEISLSLTNNDSLTAGDMCFFRLGRDTDDADDTATGDMEIRTLQMEFNR
jgi:hypothetical protein